MKKEILYHIFFTITLLSLFPMTAKAAEESPIYRFWSDSYHAHFYTASEAEKDHVIEQYPDNVWKYEGIGFRAFLENDEGLIPVYRFWSDSYHAHFYTASEAEKDHVIEQYPDNVWKYEGIAYYAYPTEQEETTSVHRFWSNSYRAHFYTATPNEKNCVINSHSEDIWKYEGQTWWIPDTGIDLTNDPTVCLDAGPNIRIGVWSYIRDDIRSDGEPFKIDANKDYVIKKEDGSTVATMQASDQTRVIYEGKGNMQIYSNDSGMALTNVGERVTFEAADGINSNLIFDAHRPPIPSSSYDDYNHYRGEIELRYTDDSKNDDIYNDGEDRRIWVINKLPLEHYTWGMAELSLANVTEHNKVMVTIFRTYGKRKTETTTQYDQLGFDVVSTPSSQKYNGYDYEISHPTIKEAAIATKGKIVTYEGDTALTAYSSWSDGETRELDQDLYPYLKSIDDPYGEHPTMSTSELLASGNHMIGLIANGSVVLAYDHDWDWDEILEHYYTGIDITSAY